ncbi:Hpt domain-containing protein [Defluviimonas sp. WL0024]|uniref:Hpt domain-containing protein n=1 Tax=Albidovulum salinarum TaxID=2984153 RepID=A0ABT2WYM6_9RHOB|nr:Hpt domain-containing protein [Defluviimonas sp. WL0024]MCU9846780.1 Hpt domain-containing protein [Defluviimonas sp. WL0024]
MSDERIDKSALKRLIAVIGGAFEDFEELRDDYVSGAPDLVEALRTSGAEADWSAMRIAAHTLKSNARDFGATRLAQLCERLEHQCRDGSVDAPQQKIDEIAAEERASREALISVSANDVTGD